MTSHSEETVEGTLTPELKAKWIAALRSDQYKQGKGALCDNGKYCCLGVLNEIGGLGCDQNGGFLESYVSDHYLLLGHDTQVQLCNMNDGIKNSGFETAPRSFPEIADYIEENL